MIYAIIEDKTINNDVYATLNAFVNYTEMFNSTFPPDSVTTWIIDTSRPPKGSSYKAKQQNLKYKAYNYTFIREMYPELKTNSMHDNIIDYFTKYAKKYGLVKVFRGEGVI